jgi:hypothetical protein
MIEKEGVGVGGKCVNVSELWVGAVAWLENGFSDSDVIGDAMILGKCTRTPLYLRQSLFMF